MEHKNIILSLIGLLLITIQVFAQDYKYEIKNINPVDSVFLVNLPQLKLPGNYKDIEGDTLPAIFDHSESPYLRPPFTQYWYSCGQASSIGYNFTFEINRVRDLPANDSANQYPPGYSWNFFNDAQRDVGVCFYYTYEAIKSNGQPNFIDFGGMGENEFKWMTGYQKYYNGMFNRISDVYSIYLGNPEGIQTLKQWLFDHLNGSEYGGLANFYTDGGLASDQLPPGTPEEGKYVKTQWGAGNGHSMTIIGWNDSIRWDYNNDGQYTNDIDINGDSIVDLKDWEIGGFKFINSFGYDWADSGFCYMMYKSVAEEKPPAGIWNKSVYVIDVKEDYSPKITFKTKIKYNQRNKLKISAGVSTDTIDYEPAHILDFEIFNYQGGQHYMQGFDTIEEQKTIEIGLDVSPLISYVNNGYPAKFFLLINEHDPEYSGEGQILNFSTIDYTDGEFEITCADSTVAINDNSNTMLSVNHMVNYDKVYIVTEELPVFEPSQPYECQLEASGGNEPYKWSLISDFDENKLQEDYPLIESEELVPVNASASVAKKLEFEFPFYGEKYDTVFLYVDGFLSFVEQQFPIPYQVNDMLLLKYVPLIAPLLNQDLNYISNNDDKIWYDGNEEYAAFRWNITLLINNNSFDVDFALILYPDGMVEYYYDDFTLPETVNWLTGFSAGDGINYQVSDYPDLLYQSNTKLLHFTPSNILTDFEITNSGLLSVLPVSDSIISNLNVRVTDDDNIFSSKEFQLSSGVLFSYTVNSGDDNWVDYGETAYLDFSLKNISNNSLNDILIILETSDSFVSLVDSIENFGPIEPGETITIENVFSFYAENDIPDQHNIKIDLIINSLQGNWFGDINIIARAPALTVGAPFIDDGDNNKLDPGETTNILLPIINSGHSIIYNVNSIINSLNEHISINGQPGSFFGAIASGAAVTDTINVTISDNFPEGVFAEFNCQINADPDFYLSNSINLLVGRFPVLIIDLDPEMISGMEVASLLGELNVPHSYIRSISENLENYMNLFVFLGKFFDPHVLSQYEGEILANFLENYGNIYLEGGSTWSDDPETAVHPMFNVTPEPITWNIIDTVTGINGTFTEGLSFPYEANMFYYDYYFSPVDPAFSILRRFSVDHGFAVAYNEGSYKTVASNIDFNGLQDSIFPSTKKYYLTQVLDFFGIEGLPTSINNVEIPDDLNLHCYPNPFSKNTSISFFLPAEDKVYLEIYDFYGNRVLSVYSGVKLSAGYHSVKIDGEKLTNGLHFCRLKTKTNISGFKIMKVKNRK